MKNGREIIEDFISPIVLPEIRLNPIYLNMRKYFELVRRLKV